MTRLLLDISMSLDGFVAGPNPSLEQPLGEGGDGLHEWGYDLASWRERHGLSGGETNRDAEVLQESLDATGAVVMGRRMFSGGEGAWDDDPRADGW
ncbi:MAG: dihydrofolate reductase family protein, partial [Gaiellaceae bacterium]